MKKKYIIIVLFLLLVVFSTTAYAAEANFSASLLTAADINCAKCHNDTPHIIHSKKPVDCVACHGDKLDVAIPQCTKCHDGPIHKVHAGKVNTQTCAYCHKNIAGVHNDLTANAVCSHCHKDLIEVHGNDTSCVKCHKSPPEIVKPLQSEEMILVCQNCHAASSVATIHGEIEDKEGCYGCHKGTSTAVGSAIPHEIHVGKAGCEACHQENGQVVVPRCTRCHDIDKLHAFNTIATLTPEKGLTCSVCHPVETKSSETSIPKAAETGVLPVETVKTENTSVIPEETPSKTPGFGVLSAIGVLMAILIARKLGKN